MVTAEEVALLLDFALPLVALPLVALELVALELDAFTFQAGAFAFGFALALPAGVITSDESSSTTTIESLACFSSAAAFSLDSAKRSRLRLIHSK